MRRKPWRFAFYALTRGLTYVTLAVLLVAVWELGVKGIMIASLTSACLVFVVSAREYVRDLVRRVDWSVGREMISFGWPTIISALAFFALNLLDRFFVKHYHGAAETGLYGVAFRYSQIVLVGVFAFRMGWPQWHYSWLNTDRHPEMVARGGRWFFGAVGFLVVLVSAWILPMFHLLMPEDYWEATRAVAPLSLAAMATGAYAVTAVGLNVTKRMRLIPPTVVAAAVVAIGLYFLLIPPFGFVGAAWATAGGLWSMALFVAIVSQRIYPVPWEWWRLGLAVGATLALALASLAVDAWLPFQASLAVRVVITLAYPAVLLLGGFLTHAERERLTGACAARRAGSAVGLREDEHLLVPRVLPLADVLGSEARVLAHPLERRVVVVERVAVEVRDDARTLLDRLQVALPRLVLPDAREEPPAGNQRLVHAHEAPDDVVERKMREDGLGDREVELLTQPLEAEVLHDDERRPLVAEPAARDLDVPARLEQVGPLLDAEVVAGLEVRHEVDPAAEGPAADVEEIVLRLQPLRDEEVELELPYGLPGKADRLPVPVGIHVPPVAAGERALERPLDRAWASPA